MIDPLLLVSVTLARTAPELEHCTASSPAHVAGAVMYQPAKSASKPAFGTAFMSDVAHLH
jgi:hypothetical protein